MINSKFNDVTGLSRYRRKNDKREALDDLKVGIKGRAEKGYPCKMIAEEIRKHHPEHPVLKEITDRDVREFLKDSGGSKNAVRKGSAAPAARPTSIGGAAS